MKNLKKHARQDHKTVSLKIVLRFEKLFLKILFSNIDLDAQECKYPVFLLCLFDKQDEN